MAKNFIAAGLKGTMSSFFRLNSLAFQITSETLIIRNKANSADRPIRASAIQLTSSPVAGGVLTSDALGNGAWATPATTIVSYPFNAVCWHRDSHKDVGNNLATVILSTQVFNHYVIQSPSANNDEFHITVLLASARYDFEVLGHKSTSSGIIAWSIDGFVIGSQDWYGVATDNVSQKILGIDLSAGTHSIKGKVTGKNVSSSGYNIPMTRYSLFRQEPT